MASKLEQQPSWLRILRFWLAIVFLFGGALLYQSHFPDHPAIIKIGVFSLLAILATPIHGRSLDETLDGLLQSLGAWR